MSTTEPVAVLCPTCGRPGVGPDESTGINYWCEPCQDWFARCGKCGATYTAPQSPYCRDGHGGALSYHPFIPYFDIALGVQVDSLAQRWRLMKPEMDGDEVSRGRLDYREKMSKGDLSARQDRIHQQLQERARG